MPNLLILSDHTVFAEDLTQQIKLYAPEFSTEFADDRPDVAIVDNRPEKVVQIRKNFPHIPLFVLINNGDEKTDQSPLVKYVTKPFDLNTFLNELKASINVATLSEAGNLKFGSFELRPSRKEIFNFLRQETVKLTEKEVAIIQYLYKNDSHIVTKNELLQEVWGYNPDVTTHTIETHIYRLRQKVEHDNSDVPFIITVDGGYTLIKN